ncbi:MAG: beta-ketoacyl-ACP synthase II [Eubacteriales bacterium]|nr:beta-ketoacyl-ACP synthase II [Eubacteriales bacterium]
MRRVVITGVGVISPVGNDVTTFWNSLCAGVCGIGRITRFDPEGMKATLAAQVKNFDPALYGMDTRAVRRMDIFSQYAMAAAQQAVENSGIYGQIEPERLGVYVGSGIGGMTTFLSETDKLREKGPNRISPLFIPMMISNIAAGNIAIRYDAQGPCLPTVTACATSTHAVGEAYRAILHGYADAVIAGGAEATINPLAVGGFSSAQALSTSQDPRRASIPFDRERAGFVMGEGAGILVLEEYEHAVKRGAAVLAEVCGYSNTCDAYHITAPREDAKCAARAIAEAAKEAGITDRDAVYINAHGTGTPLNDKSETVAIKAGLGEKAAYAAMISSTKSMTAHMLGAAGAVEAIVCALALRDGVIPPTIGYEQADPDCDLDYVPNQARQAQATLALSTSLGFGGHNGCLAFRPVKA